MKPKRKTANKDRTRTPKSKYLIIKDISEGLFSGKPLHREGFPDILGLPLEGYVKAVREEPKLLYDENHILNWRPELVCQGESFLKVIIEELRSVFLEVVITEESIERKIQARDWLEKLFDAAKEGIIKTIEFPGGRPPKVDKVDTSRLKKEYKSLSKKLKQFLKKNYPSQVQERKRFTRVIFSDGKELDTVLTHFWRNRKYDFPYKAVNFISLKNEKQTDTVAKIVRIILADKYNLKPSTVKKLVSR